MKFQLNSDGTHFGFPDARYFTPSPGTAMIDPKTLQAQTETARSESLGFKPKARANSPAAVYRLDASKALLAKALLFVKQAREDVEEVRLKSTSMSDVPNLGGLERDLRESMRQLTSLAMRPLGISLKSETPEEGP